MLHGGCRPGRPDPGIPASGIPRYSSIRDPAAQGESRPSRRWSRGGPAARSRAGRVARRPGPPSSPSIPKPSARPVRAP
ncbi:hypothetical protein GZL_04543 [Streptomyces sp. 769]|nr:hypothetical protein GZL_04543 [Streptomyces sp. 769]